MHFNHELVFTGSKSAEASIESNLTKNSSSAFSGQNPYNFEEGCAVQFGIPPKYGVIKWIGTFPNDQNRMYAGLEMVNFHNISSHQYVQ